MAVKWPREHDDADENVLQRITDAVDAVPTAAARKWG